MLKVVKKSFKVFVEFSTSGLKSNDCKGMGKVCSCVVQFNKSGTFRVSQFPIVKVIDESHIYCKVHYQFRLCTMTGAKDSKRK